jgi:hypothetical protein
MPAHLALQRLFIAAAIALLAILIVSSPSPAPRVDSLPMSELSSLLHSISIKTSMVSSYHNFTADLCNLTTTLKLYEESNYYLKNGSVNLSVTHSVPFTVSFKLSALDPNETPRFIAELNSTRGLCTPFLQQIAGNSTYSDSLVNFSGIYGHENTFSDFTDQGWALITPPNTPRQNIVRYTTFLVYKNTAISVVMWVFNDTPGAELLIRNYTNQLLGMVEAAYSGRGP